MALCDYFELVTTVIVTSVWVKYLVQTMVTSSGLLYKDEQNSTKMVIVKLLKFIGSE